MGLNMTTENAVDTGALDVLSEEFADLALDEIGEATLTERTAVLLSANGQEFRAVVLGFGSSYQTGDDVKHIDHMPGTTPTPGSRCNACRWADIAILKTVPEDKTPGLYAVVLMGKSEIPGETQRLRTAWTKSAMEVLESLYVRGKDGKSRKLPLTNAIAFRRAGKVDAGIRAICEEFDVAIPNPEADDEEQD